LLLVEEEVVEHLEVGVRARFVFCVHSHDVVPWGLAALMQGLPKYKITLLLCKGATGGKYSAPFICFILFKVSVDNLNTYHVKSQLQHLFLSSAG